MQFVFLQILAAVLAVSAVSFLGILGLLRKGAIQRLLLPMVSFAAGALLANALLDLLPEALEGGEAPASTIFTFVLAGILLFFVIERLLHWHHHHSLRHPHFPRARNLHALRWLNLFGDGVHNFIDGIAIAAAFLVDPAIGLATTIAVIAHEIPQEIGDFSLLLYTGWPTGRALTWNFLSALGAVAGAVLAYAFSTAAASSVPLLAAFAAGGLIYIAAADLVPELHKEQDFRRSLIQLFLFLVGIWVIADIGSLFAA